MPLIEQLHQKQDRVAAVLRSRKRKLSELYTATCHHHPDTADSTDVLAVQKLQAFLDANDLEKGRTFSESTLPPRTYFTRQRRRENDSPIHDASIATRNNVYRVKSPAKPAAVLSPGLRNALSPDRRVASPSPSLPKAREKSQDAHDDGKADEVHRPGAVSTDSMEVEPTKVESEDPGQPELQPSKPDVSSAMEMDQEVDEHDTSMRTVGDSSRLQTPDTTAPHPEKSRRSRSPLVLAPVATAVEPQSSPASTSGHASSNTPGPTAGSPTTSPGDDIPTLEGKGFGESSAESTNKFLPAKPNVEAQTDSQPSKQPEVNVDGIPPPQTPVDQQGQRRPPVRIDTQTGIESYFKPRSTSGIVESPAAMTTSTTPRKPSLFSAVQDQPKRATRISSGALQKKSVSEILGETPKATSPQMESPLSALSGDFSPVTANLRMVEKEKREKERSKLSTVVFAKPQRTSDASDTIEIARKAPGERERTSPKERDYLYSLFESRAYSPPKNPALTALIHEARKTISTVDHLIDYREQMNCRAMKRIYQLQNASRWPLRQIKRAEEVTRSTSHWDFLLDHAKWLRTDFREERKWKLAAASALADMCAEWVESSKEQRLLLQIRTRSPKLLPRQESSDFVMEDGPGPEFPSAQPTPELIPSTEDDSVSDEAITDPRDIAMTDAPAAIFSLGPRELAFAMQKTPASEKLLNELPLYRPTGFEPDMSKSDLAQRLDARWKQPIVPISRFANEKIARRDPEPPRKRSRYAYALEDSPRKETTPLPPKETDVALFQPENKHMRDRIHPGHSFRPPTEHPMPTQAFFETRNSSQWTHTEDDELRRLVKEYSYNWSLISECLVAKAFFSSGADRRTPWECFERWIGLEGLPADMSKTPYFRAYHSRIEAAGRHVQAQHEAAQARAGMTGQPVRKRTTQPVRVERKRTQKHLAMLDAMRKLAKKRENTLQKQQHAADLAAMRKANEANQPRPPISTPAEFSRLKHERELKMAERQEAYRQQLLAQQRAVAQQRNQGAALNVPGATHRTSNGLPNGPVAAALAGMPNGNLAVPGPARPHPVVPGIPNGLPNGVPLPPGMMGNKALHHAAQMQLMAARIGSSPEHQRRMLEQVAQVQQQQHMLQQAARQNVSQSGNHSSPNVPNASLATTNGIPSGVYAAGLTGANGTQPSSMQVDGTSRSPRNQNAMTMGQALSTGQVPLITQISNHLRNQYPQFTDEQIMAMATQQLSRYSQAQAPTAPNAQKQRTLNQAALNAAMGAANAGAAHAAVAAAAAYGQNQGMMTNDQVQQYNQRMRAQQAAQRANGGFPSAAIGTNGIVGMGSSPVLNMARPASQQGGPGQGGSMSRSATPREQRSGSTGNAGAGMMTTQGSPRQQQQA